MAAPNKKKKLRRGSGRLLTHIVIFAVLGALLITLGCVGAAKLSDYKDSYYTTARTNVFKDKTAGVEGLVKEIMLSHTKNASLINNQVISNRRKAVNELIDQEAASGVSEEEILAHAVNSYVERAKDRLTASSDETAASEIEKAAAEALPGLTESLIAQADAASSNITTKTVKATMSVTNTDGYILIYYGRALLIGGGICLAFALVLLALWLTKDTDGRAKVGQAIEPFDYLMPFLIGVGIFTFYPMIRVLIMSFQEGYHLTGNNMGTATGWGIANYKFILSGRGSDQFIRSIRNTALFVLFTVPITAAIAIVIAHLLNQKSKLNALFQTAYFMPMVTTATAVGLVWRWMFNQNSGLINAFITFFTRLFGAPENINWLQTGATNHTIPMAVLIIFGIWNSLPFTIILLLSGLQNIDEHLYTVAKVDGSGPARIFFKITVPLLSPTIGLVLIINSISAFKVYTDVFVLWNGRPEDYQMETVAWYIYNNITSNFDGMHSLGIAAAAAMVLFVIIFAFTMLQKFIQRKWVYQ
ncbi:MAG: sugar ABC transporter permease [Clostridia bacterium]|nr:sugar ABC transporter permease [Clostridia bacterium]